MFKRDTWRLLVIAKSNQTSATAKFEQVRTLRGQNLCRKVGELASSAALCYIPLLLKAAAAQGEVGPRCDGLMSFEPGCHQPTLNARIHGISRAP